ncbi:hypothetical protein M9435_001596 [Picochlorum sp. BPE23]|nr:hypothetical protein M9435_001596 [Picochlorum sp. BPE23]
MSTVFDRGIQILKNVKTDTGTIRTDIFLEACKQIIPIISKLGTAFAIVKSDVGGNIDRLYTRMQQNPSIYTDDVYRIVLDEKEQGVCMDNTSCTKGLLWLKRAMQFILLLLERVIDPANADKTLSDIATATYYDTLQQYHGWIVTGTFTVILKLVPSRNTFWKAISSKETEQQQQQCEDAGSSDDDNMVDRIKAFCQEFDSILGEIHAFLESHDLDDPTKV